MIQIVVHPTEYMVSALPVGHRDAPRWSVWVQWRGASLTDPSTDRYCISRHSSSRPNEVWHKGEQEWVYESQPSERTDEFLAATRYPLDEALAIAQMLAPGVCWNMLYPADILARDAQRAKP